MFKYQAPSNLLEGRNIIVTGAGSGIGKAASLTFAKHGATVILLGLTTSKLEAVYDLIEQNKSPQAIIYPINFEEATEEDYQRMAETVSQEFHHIDGLLHNAGLLGKLKPLSQYDYHTWQNVMNVNLNAPFLITRELLPLLRKSTDASIVFTSSSVSQKGRAHWGAYSVSKFAIEGLMQILADEEDGISSIRCNSINPGSTRTSMRASAYPGEDPLSQPAPEDIMAAYLYLMGSESTGISGKAFHAQQENHKL
ncbi:MAG: YciK family oxidoreductase [Candidatus Endonucleobacter sp. (ex Gigantidas childressi)]|nr:YciK family oxidoreductase [Candidatus Endonucleobacter sp. (ex Gigantidas childressi)]